jgi:hypothetical protein
MSSTDDNTKIFEIANDLYLTMSPDGFAVTTRQGHVHMLYKAGDKEILASSGIKEALRMVRLSPNHPTVEDILMKEDAEAMADNIDKMPMPDSKIH